MRRGEARGDRVLGKGQLGGGGGGGSSSSSSGVKFESRRSMSPARQKQWEKVTDHSPAFSPSSYLSQKSTAPRQLSPQPYKKRLKTLKTDAKIKNYSDCPLSKAPAEIDWTILESDVNILEIELKLAKAKREASD